MKSQFERDVDIGLSQPQKSLSSKYFYDKQGDELFMQIMAMPEYYLTRAELEIFTQQTEQIITALGVLKERPFELIELGAGDGTKTKELLSELVKQNFQFDYLPIDISSNVLEHLKITLKNELPSLSVIPQHGDYLQILSKLKESNTQKVILFLGSNIGNLSDHHAAEFIYELGANLHVGDKLLIGVDRVKSASIVLPAYDDKAGITREFNLNLLHRINNELGGDFDVDSFQHVAEYTEEEGVARSFLRSKIKQDVTISNIGKSYQFRENETIHTEVSRKYTTEIIQEIIQGTDFTIIDVLTDSQNYFSDFILERS